MLFACRCMPQPLQSSSLTRFSHTSTHSHHRSPHISGIRSNNIWFSTTTRDSYRLSIRHQFEWMFGVDLIQLYFDVGIVSHNCGQDFGFTHSGAAVVAAIANCHVWSCELIPRKWIVLLSFARTRSISFVIVGLCEVVGETVTRFARGINI